MSTGLRTSATAGCKDVAVAGPNVSAGHDNHRDLRVQPAQRPEHFPTRHAGHQEIAVRSRSVPCARSLRTTVVMISTTPRRKLTVEPSAVQARQLSATLPSAIAASVFRLASSSRFVRGLLNDTFFVGSLFSARD